MQRLLLWEHMLKVLMFLHENPHSKLLTLLECPANADMTTCQHGWLSSRNKSQRSWNTKTLSYVHVQRPRGSTLSKVECALFPLSERNTNPVLLVKDGTLIGWKSKQELLTFSKKLLRHWLFTEENDDCLLLNTCMSSIFLHQLSCVCACACVCCMHMGYCWPAAGERKSSLISNPGWKERQTLIWALAYWLWWLIINIHERLLGHAFI